VAYASGQSGWDLFNSTLLGGAIGASTGALNPFAAVSSAVIRTSLTGAAASTLGQVSTMAFDGNAKFSPLQVGLSAIPGPFSTMDPLVIASAYRTGNVFSSVAGSTTAAGVQLGVLGSIRGLTQAGIGIIANNK